MARRSKKGRCPVSERGMVAAFALARSNLDGDADSVHAAKASGERMVSVSEAGFASRCPAKRDAYTDRFLTPIPRDSGISVTNVMRCGTGRSNREVSPNRQHIN